MLAARGAMLTALEKKHITGPDADALLEPFDKQLAKYKFAQIRVIEPQEDFSDTLEFDPAKIRKAIDAGRAAVDTLWPSLQPFVS